MHQCMICFLWNFDESYMWWHWTVLCHTVGPLLKSILINLYINPIKLKHNQELYKTLNSSQEAFVFSFLYSLKIFVTVHKIHIFYNKSFFLQFELLTIRPNIMGQKCISAALVRKKTWLLKNVLKAWTLSIIWIKEGKWKIRSIHVHAYSQIMYKTKSDLNNRAMYIKTNDLYYLPSEAHDILDFSYLYWIWTMICIGW